MSGQIKRIDTSPGTPDLHIDTGTEWMPIGYSRERYAADVSALAGSAQPAPASPRRADWTHPIGIAMTESHPVGAVLPATDAPVSGLESVPRDVIDALLLRHGLMDQWPTQRRIHEFVRDILAAASQAQAPTAERLMPTTKPLQINELEAIRGVFMPTQNSPIAQALQEESEHLSELWEKASRISGSALLAGEKHGKNDKAILYQLSCEVLSGLYGAKHSLKDIAEAVQAPTAVQPPAYCCAAAWSEARLAAWKARGFACGCDPRREYCDRCIPPEFRPGGEWDQSKPTSHQENKHG